MLFYFYNWNSSKSQNLKKIGPIKQVSTLMQIYYKKIFPFLYLPDCLFWIYHLQII